MRAAGARPADFRHPGFSQFYAAHKVLRLLLGPGGFAGRLTGLAERTLLVQKSVNAYGPEVNPSICAILTKKYQFGAHFGPVLTLN